MDHLPDESILHLANSMSVRYANFISLQPGQSVEVFANRGTSGIDGSTGTALGAALGYRQTGNTAYRGYGFSV
jgi:2-succinyl-5-enolpyruvyl-6-hydroxy-3-cyclohexene-1-carboxylate synthase